MKSSFQESKIIYVLPNLFTAGNLFFGFMAVLQIFQGTLQRSASADDWVRHYEYSLYCILAAFICDILDGRVARLGGQESPFGREFDSLADIISFGIAPALLVFKIVLYELAGRTGWIIAFIYLVCGALRLARFNVMAACEKPGSTKAFTGFPIPAAAGLIASITLLLLRVYEHDHGIGFWKYFLAALMLFLSFMMFSKYEYPSFKSVSWNTRFTIPRFLAVILLCTLTLMYYWFMLAALFTAYLLYGFLRPYLSTSRRRLIEEGDPGEEDPHLQDP